MKDSRPLTRRRVLVHAYERIWPTDCGFHLRCWQVLGTLQELGATVEVIAADGPKPERGRWTEEACRHLAARGIELHRVPFHVGSVDFWWAAAWHVWSRRLRRQAVAPPTSPYYHRPGLEAAWRRRLRSGRYHAAILNYAPWHRLARAAKKAGVWCATEMHELLADQLAAREELTLGRPTPEGRRHQLLEEELRCLAASDCVLAINPQEGERIRSRLPVPVVDLPFCLPDPAPADAVERVPPTDLLVVGSFIEHNKRGLRQFMEGAWPALKAARPGIRLTVCGRVGEDLGPDDAVVCRPRVPDLTPYYHAASVVLITTVTGAGIKIKTIEALAHGCCVVAHRHSVAGTPFVAGTHGELLDDLGKAAPVVGRLLDDAAARQRYREQARALHRAHFSMDHSRRVLAQTLSPAARADR